MARLAITDYLQNHTFWLMDAGPIRSARPPALTPTYAFSSVSAPSIEAQVTTIRQANHPHGVPVITGGEEGPITLRRGASFGDTEFYRWIAAAVRGDPSAHPAMGVLRGVGAPPVYIRRDLLLIHFFPRLPFVQANTALNTGPNRVGSQGGLGGALLQALIPAPFEGGLRIPARAWLLKGCVPTKYVAASDFDAGSAAVSLVELTVQPEHLTEINLGS